MADQEKAIAKRESAMARLQKVGMEIDELVEDSLPITTKAATNFVESLSIARAIADLRSIFLNNPEIQRVTMHMMNNRLGFLTDRPNKKNPKPYSYDKLVNPIVEGLLKGYRISGNEMNIIAGQFYAAKAGSFRRIIEWPGVINFKYGNQPVLWPSSGGSYARVKTWATWEVQGKKFSVGLDQDDDATFQIRINTMMGEDAIVGKAHSKLFKRVLERLSGQVLPEFTDIEPADVSDAQYTSEPSPEQGHGRDLDDYNGQPTNIEEVADAEGMPETSMGPVDEDSPPFEDGAETMGVPADQVAAGQEEPPEELTEEDELPPVVNDLIERLYNDFPLMHDLPQRVMDYAAHKEVSVEEIASRIKTFPVMYKNLVAYINPDLMEKRYVSPKEEEPPKEEPPAEKPDMGIKMGDPEWWNDTKNWVNRRSTPYLYLIRVGMGLPFRKEKVERPGDKELPMVHLDSQAAWQKEVDDNPKAFGTLLKAQAEIVNRARNKLRGMGYDPELWNRWYDEKTGRTPDKKDEEKAKPEPVQTDPKGNHLVNGTKVAPLPPEVSPDQRRKWQLAIDRWPVDLAYIVTQEDLPRNDQEVTARLADLYSLLENDGKKSMKF